LCPFRSEKIIIIIFFLPWVFASCCVYEIMVRDFRLRNAMSVAVTIYSLVATCFGRTSIFKWKYM
jgi:hypothetical protein